MELINGQDLSTVEWMLAAGLAAALNDVQKLTVTREQASEFLTDETMAEWGDIFNDRSAVGLVDFISPRKSVSDKVTAFYTVTGITSPLLVVAARRITDLGKLHSVLGASAVASMIDGPMSAAEMVIGQAMRFVGVPDTEEGAEEFILAILNEAVEEVIKGRPDLPHDSVVRS